MFRPALRVALFSATSLSHAQANADWLAGTTWVLCDSAQAQEGKRDALVFEAGGNGKLLRPEGNLGFRHQVTGNTVALSTPTSQRPVQMIASANRELLLLRGPDGSAVASYARQGSAAMAQCRIK